MDFTALHPFDIVLAALALVFIIIGMYHGLIHEAVRLLAVFAGFGAAVGFYRRIYYHIGFLPVSDSVRLVIGFIALFLAGVAVVFLAGWVVQKIVHLTVLGWVDRLFGGLFGLIKVLLIAWVFVKSAESSPFTAQKKKLAPAVSYRFLSSVPPHLSLPYLSKTGKAIQLKVGEKPLRTINDAKNTFEQLRQKVDSAKAIRDKLEETQ